MTANNAKGIIDQELAFAEFGRTVLKVAREHGLLKRKRRQARQLRESKPADVARPRAPRKTAASRAPLANIPEE